MFDWIVQSLAAGGYAGIAALMFIENIFPPIPSELIMSSAGFAAARGDLDLFLVIIWGTAGSLLGILPWYYAGRILDQARLKRLAARHGRWITMTPADVDRAGVFFVRYGKTAVLFGRLVPTIRTLISVPAGIVAMPFVPFLALSAIGTLAWTALLALAGYLLREQFEAVYDYLNPISTAVVVVLVVVYVWRVVTWRPLERHDAP
jgi:membrane protein DedA with SNARE-associated domain